MNIKAESAKAEVHIAFSGANSKDFFLARVEYLTRHDGYVQDMDYYDGGGDCGCKWGALLRSKGPGIYALAERELRIPRWLVLLMETLFEHLPKSEFKLYPLQGLKDIPDLAVLTLKLWRDFASGMIVENRFDLQKMVGDESHIHIKDETKILAEVDDTVVPIGEPRLANALKRAVELHKLRRDGFQVSSEKWQEASEEADELERITYENSMDYSRGQHLLALVLSESYRDKPTRLSYDKFIGMTDEFIPMTALRDRLHTLLKALPVATEAQLRQAA